MSLHASHCVFSLPPEGAGRSLATARREVV
jgi:hypothetical protein